MQKIIYNKSKNTVGLGNPSSAIQFLLPTPPTLECSDINIKDIVAINGNHWRKIFVIIAKLCCQHKTWQSYRDNDLLNDVYLNFSPTPTLNKRLNFVCGKTHAQMLGILETGQCWPAIDELNRVRINNKNMENRILITPYLDYRQFPNALIADVITAL